MVRPTFLGIGAQRCGTTWLFENLRRHPSVTVPDEKELNFFSLLGESSWGRGLDWYLGRFGENPATAVGEITPEYLVDPGSAERIEAALGTDIRILVVVRHPVERAFSAYAKGVRDGDWDCSFSQFFEQNMDQCVDRGLYHAQLQRYCSRFPRVTVLVYDDLRSDPIGFLGQVWDAIGVERYSTGFEELRFNLGVAAPSRRAGWIIRGRDLFYRVHPGFRRVVKGAQRSAIPNKILSRALKAGRGGIPRQDVGRLGRVFRGDTQALSDLLKRDLDREWFGER